MRARRQLKRLRQALAPSGVLNSQQQGVPSHRMVSSGADCGMAGVAGNPRRRSFVKTVRAVASGPLRTFSIVESPPRSISKSASRSEAQQLRRSHTLTLKREQSGQAVSPGH